MLNKIYPRSIVAFLAIFVICPISIFSVQQMESVAPIFTSTDVQAATCTPTPIAPPVVIDVIASSEIDHPPPTETPINFLTALLGSEDVDGDGVLNNDDNCIFAHNPAQSDRNGDGEGDACDEATNKLADLRVSPSVVQGYYALINSSVDFRFFVTNAGPNSTKGVVLTAPIPAGTIFVSAAATQGSCSGNKIVVCDLGFIKNGMGALVTIRLKPTVIDKLGIRASVSLNLRKTSVRDPNMFNDARGSDIESFDRSKTYSITGSVMGKCNDAISGAKVGLTGPVNISVLTDSEGNFSLTNLPSGGYYELIVSKSGYSFRPSIWTTHMGLRSDQLLDFVGEAGTEEGR